MVKHFLFHGKHIRRKITTEVRKEMGPNLKAKTVIFGKDYLQK